MFANYKFNINNINSNISLNTINIPINMDFQLVDTSDTIENVFVKDELKRAVNEIIDYEKIRYQPVNLSGNPIRHILYNVNFINGNKYSDIGFTDEDIRLKREVFKQSFLNLNFYDSDNPMSQNLLFRMTLFSRIPDGIEPNSNAVIQSVLSNPILEPNGVAEGYNLYHFKDFLNIGETKYLYMRASFRNAKDGKITNLSTQNTPLPIDEIIKKLHVRYILFRDNTGYYYKLDNTYQGGDYLGNQINGSNNVVYINNEVVFMNLYQINVI